MESKSSTAFVEASTARTKWDVRNFLRLRLADAKDDLGIGELLVRSFLTTYEKKLPHIQTAPTRIAELLGVRDRRESGEVYIFELGFKMVGTFSLLRSGSKLNEAWMPEAANLRAVAVDPDYQGYGFADMILSSASATARSWGVKRICLHVLEGATRLAELYQRYGYRRDPSGDFIAHGYRLEGYTLELTSFGSARSSTFYS